MKETKTEAISSAILCILSGLVLCIFNVSILTTITRVIGLIFLIIAILFLYTYFKKRNSTTFTTLILSLFLLSAGLYMSFDPKKFISILPMLVGIVLIINSPVFRGLHHECLEAVLRKSWDSPVFIVVFCTLNLFYFFYLFGIIMV